MKLIADCQPPAPVPQYPGVYPGAPPGVSNWGFPGKSPQGLALGSPLGGPLENPWGSCPLPLSQTMEIEGIIAWIAGKADAGASVTANLYALDGPGSTENG